MPIKPQCKERATELSFLQYFYAHAGACMGPADGDIYDGLKRSFMRKTGRELPYGYNLPEDEDGD